MNGAVESSHPGWRTAIVAVLVVAVALTLLIGFVWLPYGQAGGTPAGLWDAICRAAGVVEPWRPAQQPTGPVARPSNVIVAPDMMASSDTQAIGRGATLALRCTMCHGARGVSDANTPNLAGQDAGAIYKQLRDYRAAQRPSAVMAPLVQGLSDQEMRDLAAYYASLAMPTHPEPFVAAPEIVTLVRNGAPMRNIAACDSCHGMTNTRIGTPRLDGQPYPYLRAQLLAFTTGTRRNDLHSQMRNVARQMTPEEIEGTARYYATR